MTTLNLEEQIALYDLVRTYDIDALALLSPQKWNELIQCEQNPAYLNLGTPVHWAIWHRHWAIVSLAAASGCDLSIKGQGCWMNDKTPLEYAVFLDNKAGHPYYHHQRHFKESVANNTMAHCFQLQRQRRNLEAHRWGGSDDVHVLHDVIEFHSLVALESAHRHFGESLGMQMIGPVDNPHGNLATMAHFCVWYQHWDMLTWLVTHQCYSESAAGEGGGWTGGRTVVEYAKHLESSCAHPFYSIARSTQSSLASAAPPSVLVSNSTPTTSAVVSGGPSLCCLCISKNSDHALLPCGHLCLCGGCVPSARSLVRCPICRTEIENTQRIFMI